MSKEPITLLIVDNEEEILYFLMEHFKKRGYQHVLGARNADEALEKVKTFDPDVILLDEHLGFSPTGWEALTMIREYGSKADIRMIFTHEGRTTERRVLESGANGFLLKPFAHGELDQLVFEKIPMHLKRQNKPDAFENIMNKTPAELIERLQKELAEAKEALVKSERKASRVGMAIAIAHEIKNSLSGVTGQAALAKQHYLPDLMRFFGNIKPRLSNLEQHSFLHYYQNLEKTFDSIIRAGETIYFVASTADGTIGENPESFGNIHFSGFIKQIRVDLQDELLNEHCEFQIESPERFIVFGNSQLLERVFVNLIRNALEAMRDQEKKKLTLICCSQTVGSEQVSYFEFTDNGPGIPSKIQKEIFDQGFSTKEGPAINSREHGHGLYTCKQYIEQIHHGQIKVVSETGKGTTFIFWLPMSKSVT